MVSLRLSFPGTLRERTRHREAPKLTGALLIFARGESANYLARYSNYILTLFAICQVFVMVLPSTFYSLTMPSFALNEYLDHSHFMLHSSFELLPRFTPHVSHS